MTLFNEYTSKNLKNFRENLAEDVILTEVNRERANTKKMCILTKQAYIEPLTVTIWEKNRAINVLTRAARESLMYTDEYLKKASAIIKKNTIGP